MDGHHGEPAQREKTRHKQELIQALHSCEQDDVSRVAKPFLVGSAEPFEPVRDLSRFAKMRFGSLSLNNRESVTRRGHIADREIGAKALSEKLKKAIDAGEVELLRQLLSASPALVSEPINWGPMFRKCQTEPLHYLSDAPFNQLWSHGKQAELAQVLIEAGAPVDGLPTSGETPLHGAASLGEPGVAEVLIDHGANLEVVANYPGIPDGTPLDFAVHFGMVEVVDLLVQRGAKVLSTRMAAGVGLVDRVQDEFARLCDDHQSLVDVFRCAAVCDRTHVVDFLLTNDIDINTDIDGATALHWAAWEAKPVMVGFLLERGADHTILDGEHKLAPTVWAQHRRKELGPRWEHDEVISILNRASFPSL